MSDSDRPRVEPYAGPAGGWDALSSVARSLRRERVPVKGAQALLKVNQPEGFDCPGCAWPDRDHRSSFQFCENGAKAVAHEVTAHRAGPDFFAAHTVSALAARSDHWLEAQGRLTHPLRYDAATDRYQPIEWQQAFDAIARHLNGLASPHQAAFYTSGRTSNEAAFLYQLFVRAFGTNNLPDCSNMCHEASGAAMRPQIGVGKGTVTLADFEQADAIFVWGQNPGTNHPRMLGELRDAHRRGARVVSFNPLRERGLERFADPKDALEMATFGATPISTHYFQLRAGGDLAAATGMLKRLVDRHAAGEAVFDSDFIAQHTTGFDALCQSVAAQPWPLLCEASGLTQAQLCAAADVYAGAARVIFCWGMGITQHRDSVATIQMLVNLLLARGQIGTPGAGPCPVRGHSNVQGDRTMGIWEKPPAALLDRIEREFGFAPPRAHGLDTLGTVRAMQAGQVRVFFGLGGNFAQAAPDTAATHAALRRCALTVHVATKLNRSHLVHGQEALILPCLGRSEIDLQAGVPQGVTVEDSMSQVHLSYGLHAPASEHLLSEVAIVARLAQATLGGRPGPQGRLPWLDWARDYGAIRTRIAAVFDDFHDFNRRVAVPGGFHLRNSARERDWAPAGGRARFCVHPVPLPQKDAGAIKVFTLITLRSHDQYNTTVYGLDDRFRGVYGQRDVLFIHPDDLRALGLAEGERVDLATVWHDGVERRVAGLRCVPHDLPRGNLAAYYPETNPLVPLDAADPAVGTPASKSVPVLVERHVAPS